jgi:FkbH-like protein
MKLIDAMRINRAPGGLAGPVHVGLACSFSPLHLKTFVTAHLRNRLDMRLVEIADGRFGDLVGTVNQMTTNRLDALIVVVEWSDLDPRLGIRSSAAWAYESLSDIVVSVRNQIQRIIATVAKSQTPTILSLPTIEPPPISPNPTWLASPLRLQLDLLRARFAMELSAIPKIRIVSDHQLAIQSPVASRFDVRGELGSGFPYSLIHANALSELLSIGLFPPVRKKGLIVDLDNTLWRGIVGEDGIRGVHWDIDSKAQSHALLQQLLTSLASSGVMVGIASKNDPVTIRSVFTERDDLIVKAAHIYPFEVNWAQKSKSIERILAAWNISADSVVFVDDSSMEIEEVKHVLPSMECILFPTKDEEAIYRLILKLRDLFGLETVLQEDRLRIESIRQGDAFKSNVRQNSGESLDGFLQELKAEVSLSFGGLAGDQRSLELINKTNQFNLNGRRYLANEWERLLARPDGVLLGVSYQDKFGPLGKIAVVVGRINGSELLVDNWVMSCRAFSRRIEHRIVDCLLSKFNLQTIAFDYALTEKNGPIQEFLFSITRHAPATGRVFITAEMFCENRPNLYHTTKETTI